MVEYPKVQLIDELHWLGRKLEVLKKLYQSYELIMRRLLLRQRLFQHQNPESVLDSQVIISHDMVQGVSLSSAAVGRFERLMDRIKLYCLSEIDMCLREKESLTLLVSDIKALLCRQTDRC